MAFTKEELQKIRAALTAAELTQLADNFNLKPGSLRNILAGRAKNEAVVLAAFDKAEEQINRIRLAKSKLSEV